MFRKIIGIGLIVLLLSTIFGGFGSRSRAAYYEGYSDGIQAQTSTAAEESAETAPPATHYRDGYGHGRFLGWGIFGIFAIFFKMGFFFLMAMLFMRMIFGRHRWHRRGPWGRGHHRKHEPGHEKSPKWMDDSDDDEPIMTV